jgi:hypothetical protein
MATSTYLSNPVVTVNAVDLTDQCTAATFTHRFDQLENTSFGKTARTYQAGLGNHEVVLTLYQSYIVGETYQTLAALVGSTTTVTVADVAAGEVFTLTDCYLTEMPVINATLGELSTIDVTFVGGTYSVV